MLENLPYSTSAGTLEKVLEKIKTPPPPERFTQDFVSTKLQMKGGAAKMCIPFLKKMGLVATDGTPTELYSEYRNPAKSRHTLGKCFRKLYARLYEMNEYVHDATDADVLGLIVECTGAEHDSATTKYTVVTFNMLRKHSDFEEVTTEVFDEVKEEGAPNIPISFNYPPEGHIPASKSLNLSYTINLNLPPTKDIEVFNAIFKSLKEHIIKE